MLVEYIEASGGEEKRVCVGRAWPLYLLAGQLSLLWPLSRCNMMRMLVDVDVDADVDARRSWS